MINKDDWENAAQSFESSLMILRKDKNGWVIGFSVHPDEAPTELLEAPLGTRFRIVLFQIGDDELPVPTQENQIGFDKPSNVERDPVSIAGQLCRTLEFQQWIIKSYNLVDREMLKESNEESPEVNAASALRLCLGIASRSQIGTNQSARDRFKILCSDFRKFQMSKASDWIDLDECSL